MERWSGDDAVFLLLYVCRCQRIHRLVWSYVKKWGKPIESVADRLRATCAVKKGWARILAEMAPRGGAHISDPSHRQTIGPPNCGSYTGSTKDYRAELSTLVIS